MGAQPRRAGPRRHSAVPGRAVAALAGKFNLIYIDTFPSGGEAARRGFVEKLWELLEPKNGILVLPSVNRLLLPAEAQWAVLPGTRGQRVAASREAVSTDLDLLDGRLRALLEPFGEENHIPAGIFAALYYTPSPPVLPAPENDPAFAKPVSPEWFYETLFCFLLGRVLREKRVDRLDVVCCLCFHFLRKFLFALFDMLLKFCKRSRKIRILRFFLLINFRKQLLQFFHVLGHRRMLVV